MRREKGVKKMCFNSVGIGEGNNQKIMDRALIGGKKRERGKGMVDLEPIPGV